MAGTQKAEALSRLAAGVAHDFNNFLAIIMGCADLQMAISGTSDKQLELSAEIKKIANKASKLNAQLLAFSGRRSSEPRPILLNQVVQEMAGLLERLVGRQVNLSLRLESELPAVCADRTQIEQILMNLVANAKDAIAGAGSVTVETDKVYLDDQYANQHSVVRPGWFTRLSVTDTGCGMDQETQKHIFEPFFTTKEDKGTGLGLATVYGIVKDAGGFVWVYSEVGWGTTFKIYFPIPAGPGAAEQQALPNIEDAVRTVLIVDNDDSLRRLTPTMPPSHRGLLSFEIQEARAHYARVAEATPDSEEGKAARRALKQISID